jgi:GT2 family glycosyltransferase
MQLSIIIINYNTFELTSSCIRSVLKNITDISYEVILIDNGSVECPPRKFKELFPSIVLIEEPQNLGFAGGNNAGLEVAGGEVILLLNSDVEVQDNTIEKMYKYLIARDKVGVVSSRLVYPSGEVQGCCQRFPSVHLELLELTRVQKLLGKRRGRIMLGFFFDHASEMEADWVWGTFFMVKKSVVAQLPGKKFPNDYFMYGEDMQWCYYIKKLGYKVMFNPAGTVVHHVSMSSSRDFNFDKHKLMRDNEFLFLKESYGDLRARLVFVLRAINYLTLARHDTKFKILALYYWQRAFTWRFCI